MSGTRSDIRVDTFTTILMQMPTGAIGIITLLIAIYVTNRIKTRFIVIAFLCLPAIAGACGLIYIGRDNVRGLMGCYYVCYLFATLRELTFSPQCSCRDWGSLTP